MSDYVQITVSCSNSEESSILVALLSEAGFEGFEETDGELRCFIPEIQFDETSLKALLSTRSVSYSKTRIPFRNWNEEWEKNFVPVTVGSFCGIRAAFQQPIPEVRHEVIITPKMSFGTGHHATTWLMIEAMGRFNFQGSAVLDFGTGTGILAILSEKLGADSIYAIDNDPLCITNAAENIEANNTRKIVLQLDDKIPRTVRRFDIILANINRNVILEQLPFFKQQLTPTGVLIVGGLLFQDLEFVESAALNNSLSITSKHLKDNWLCLEIHQGFLP